MSITGWNGINEGTDTGNDVEANLTTAFNALDTTVGSNKLRENS